MLYIFFLSLWNKVVWGWGASRLSCLFIENGILTKPWVQSETKPQSLESGHLLKGIMSRDVSPCRSV